MDKKSSNKEKIEKLDEYFGNDRDNNDNLLASINQKFDEICLDDDIKRATTSNLKEL